MESLSGGGVVNIERAAVSRVPPLTFDQQTGGDRGEEIGLTLAWDSSRINEGSSHEIPKERE